MSVEPFDHEYSDTQQMPSNDTTDYASHHITYLFGCPFLLSFSAATGLELKELVKK